jgi:hypothetical protein
MKVELLTPKRIIELFFIHAIEGARFAHKSKAKYPSGFDILEEEYHIDIIVNISDEDISLAKKLASSGVASGHDKFLQSIPFLVDISWSRAMWQEFDTYRVGVSKQSESTMHTLTKDSFSFSDFESEFDSEYTIWKKEEVVGRFLAMVGCIKEDLNSGKISDKEARETLKGCLPECFIQKRRVSLNFASMKTIYFQRYNHRAMEWRHFCDYMKKELPLFNDICNLPEIEL